MRAIRTLAVPVLLVLGLAAAAAAAPATVEIEFVHPERFGKVAGRPDGDRLRAAYLDALREHVVARATPRLAEGSTLVVAITDVVTAGTIEPSRRSGNDPRFLRDVSPARIELGFRLVAADGSVVRSGERRLSDPTLFGSPELNPADPLRYEKALLDRWLERELANVLAPGG